MIPLYPFLFLLITGSHILEAHYDPMKPAACRNSVVALPNQRRPQNMSELLRSGVTYGIVTGDSYRVLRLSHIRFKETDDPVLFFEDPHSQSTSIVRASSIEGILEVDRALSQGNDLTINQKYKFRSDDGRVLNMIFLGEKNTTKDQSTLTTKRYFFNLETRRIESYFTWELGLHSVKTDSPINTGSPPNPKKDHATPYQSFAVSKNGKLRLSIDKSLRPLLSPEQNAALKIYAQNASDAISKLDASAKGMIPDQEVSAPIDIRLLNAENGDALHIPSPRRN
jgi:hypothetical protein